MMHPPNSASGLVDPCSALLWKGAAQKKPCVGLVCLALSYQPLCLCIQSVVAPTTSAAVAVSLMENTVFPLGLKIDPSRASLPSALLDNR